MLLNTKLPTVIAECGFLSNGEEAALIDTQEYRHNIAQAVFEGIENYYKRIVNRYRWTQLLNR